MNTYAPTLDAVLETEEFITAEEYMRRRERGEINPADALPRQPVWRFYGQVEAPTLQGECQAR